MQHNKILMTHVRDQWAEHRRLIDENCTTQISNGNPMVSSKIKYKIYYFYSGSGKGGRHEGKCCHNTASTQWIQTFIQGISCFKGTFSLQDQYGAKLYQAPPKIDGICISTTFQRWVGPIQEAINYHYPRCRWNIRMACDRHAKIREKFRNMG